MSTEKRDSYATLMIEERITKNPTPLRTISREEMTESWQEFFGSIFPDRIQSMFGIDDQKWATVAGHTTELMFFGFRGDHSTIQAAQTAIHLGIGKDGVDVMRIAGSVFDTQGVLRIAGGQYNKKRLHEALVTIHPNFKDIRIPTDRSTSFAVAFRDIHENPNRLSGIITDGMINSVQSGSFLRILRNYNDPKEALEVGGYDILDYASQGLLVQERDNAVEIIHGLSSNQWSLSLPATIG